jgi:hypothetical protein
MCIQSHGLVHLIVLVQRTGLKKTELKCIKSNNKNKLTKRKQISKQKLTQSQAMAPKTCCADYPLKLLGE